MREISPAVNLSVDDFLAMASDEMIAMVNGIRRAKREGARPRPSTSLIDESKSLTKEKRERLLDKVAELVDENYCGRSEMCVQFAMLLDLSLRHLGLRSRAVMGTATYYDERRRVLFEWDHAWVRIGAEVVDGNTDILFENPMVPKTVSVPPYWGPITCVPADRRLHENRSLSLPHDGDVTDVWWPELRAWIDGNAAPL